MTEVTNKKVLEFKDLDEDEFIPDLSKYGNANYFRFINVKINILKFIKTKNYSVEIIDSQIDRIKDGCLKELKLINSYVGDIDVVFINKLKFRNSKIEKTLILYGVNVVDIESNDIKIDEACDDIDIVSVGSLDIFMCDNMKLNIKSFKEIFIDDTFNSSIKEVELICDLDNFSLQNLYFIKEILEMEKVEPMNFDENELDERIYILENMNKSKSAKK